MEFKRLLGGGVALMFLSSFAPASETRMNTGTQYTADARPALNISDESQTTALDPFPTERGRYSCRSRGMHGEPLYFSVPNGDNVLIDCEAGTTNLISRTTQDTSPLPEGR